MIKKDRLYLFVMVSTICMLNSSYLLSMQQSRMDQALQQVDAIAQRANNVREIVNNSVTGLNYSLALAHSSNDRSIQAIQSSTQALEHAQQALIQANEAVAAIAPIQELHAQVAQYARTAAINLETEFNRLREAFAQEVERNERVRADGARRQDEFDRETKIQLQAAEINEKHRIGLYKQKEKIKAQAKVDAETVKWKKLEKMIDNPKRIIKFVLAITTIALGVYAAKYGIPMVMNYFTQPRVVSETSRKSWFDWSEPQQKRVPHDLIFTPSLHKQLFDLALRVQSAKIYNENLPNLLFYGAPGTGKTAFAKELAYYSGLDYALTSGSEFAKITDPNLANNELRKLLNWAQSSANGLIVLIDEAESLFANRMLPTTPKSVQDFINTFLALIPDKSQKNVMFIFATNHPFKLDDAITDRIGISIEFTLPEKAEREKILSTYLEKFAQENIEAIVDLAPEVVEALPRYAGSLEVFCPRAIKFVAQEMIVNARQQASKQVTTEIAQGALDQVKRSLEQTEAWGKARAQWAKALVAASA